MVIIKARALAGVQPFGLLEKQVFLQVLVRLERDSQTMDMLEGHSLAWYAQKS